MKIGAFIIGDVLLSGKREDRHFSYLQSLLAKRGLELDWTIIVGDEPEQLQRFLAFSLSSDDLVFSFGGIGATPDDRTRQTVAKVAEVPLLPHPEAVSLIEQQFGEMAYPNRILMANLPEGSRIIPNPINNVPGFSFKNHHFMPGFPEMSWPMSEWILDNLYPDLRNESPESEQIIYILNGHESELLDAMGRIVVDYPELRLSSLPHHGKRPHIELSLRGNNDLIIKAMNFMKQEVESTGFSWVYQLDDSK
ncbi:MAG: competence/damage-inducible protein A [Methylophaga sp.]|nr:competence/damage-inducible protein A [Methylophaga sp.]